MLTVQQAVRANATLADVAERAWASRRLLQRVAVHLPPGLRDLVQAGPLEEGTWCVLAANPSVAAKVRQLVPVLLAAARNAGAPVQELRVRVAGRSRV
ncbi:MAG: DciA family protein [Tepidimonas ignava]|uniref:DciA family protein n=1 Tax=Tepidimonas ignava TaxID=114249 RepID=UPI002FD96CAA